MTINASHLSASRAIDVCYDYITGHMEFESEYGEDVNMLSIYLEGEPGVGKSYTPFMLARKLGYKLVDIRANMMNPDDAGGTRMQDMDARKTVWFPPEWMPEVDGTVEGTVTDKKSPYFGQPYRGTILFFDELASADDRVRKPLFGAFLDRSLNGRPLPKNCVVMAAGNESETGTMVFELDNATRTRFVTLRIVDDIDVWLEDFAPNSPVTSTTVSYLKENIHRFCETEAAIKEGRGIYGNPRAWVHVSIVERAIMRKPEDRTDKEKIERLRDAVAGKVGTENAAGWMGTFENVADMSNLYDIMKASKEDRKKLWPKSLGQLYALTYSMMAYPQNIEQAKQIMEIANEMPHDSDIPFKEQTGPLLEVILRKLRKNGVDSNEINKAFKKDTDKETSDIFAAGPLIKL